MAKSIYFVAGEASADNHGAALMESLRWLDVDLRFLGRGGPRMKTIAGENFKNWIDEAAVVGLWEVIKRYGYFRKQFHETRREIAESKPDAVVLIDYPGFNLRLARALRNIGFQPVGPAGVTPADAANKMFAGRADQRSTFRRTPPKIIYYISPQVWAWNRGRIRQMARWLDLMVVIFPFEADLYNQSGLRAIFAGHPMLDNLRAAKIEMERDPNLIALFPGSRQREVRKILPVLLETADELRKEKPNMRFTIAAASDELATEIKQALDRSASGGQDRDVFEVRVGKAAQIMQRAIAGIIASGSATLEATYFRLPFVLVYKVSWLTYFAARLVVKVKHLGMPNVLANTEVVSEFIQHRAKPRAIAQAVACLVDNREARSQMLLQFDSIVETLGEGGASERAAEAIYKEIVR